MRTRKKTTFDYRKQTK